MLTVFKVSELALRKNCTVFLKCYCSLKTSLFVLFNATAESVNCCFFLKNVETHFCNVICKKNFVKYFENLLQHVSEKFIGDNLSITDIALKNWDLSIIGNVQRFFDVIDYRYSFNTERFIVPITGFTLGRASRKHLHIITSFTYRKNKKYKK